ncbi:HHL138Cp [Eremothecium sinecaudum]|uniref:Ubiquitin-conjugating enzyme E2 6 n=1 Tax=Eremothecium sinecaudum TaxID=45286 RepID=A0A0X8HW98_9SACH|nr:HHL138Cp [Eremothecium sinecaudum]AMD22632.1 HHL138Cp [Eremothecium sinecaudum]
MASQQGVKRLTREYKMIKENPPPYITAVPHEDYILLWHYVITGPPDTPYEGGQYHGTLLFPSEYPFKPPAIKMITPNGRFKENTRLCLSMSDFHPDTWNPSWSVATILTGLLSFMTGDEQTSGSINTGDAQKRLLARKSKAYNAKSNSAFQLMFPELVKKNLEDIELSKQIEESKEKDNRKYNYDKLEKEKAVSLDQIEDPEDRIRAELLSKQDKDQLASNSGRSGIMSWSFFILAIVLVICCLR